MLFVGVDPGLSGAVAWLDGERKRIGVMDCPVLTIVDGKKKRRAYDFPAMARIIRALASEALVVTMEEVHSMPNDGKRQAFSFGLGYGAWRGILGSLDQKPNLVSPQRWKGAMLTGIANDKEFEAKALQGRFQVTLPIFGPKGGVLDGRVDAFFLAEFGRMTWRLSGGMGSAGVGRLHERR